MSKKTVVLVDMYCSKCVKKVLKLVACIEGINSVVLDSSKGTATIIGEADPTIIVEKVRKFRKSARLDSFGPAKEEKKKEETKKEEKKEEKKECPLPKTCQRCDTWIFINEYSDGPCSIL